MKTNFTLERASKIQFWVLLAGTIFAWCNFAYELYNWIADQTNAIGCTVETKNPFLTPCFYGAIFFLISFVLSLQIRKLVKKGK